MVHLDKPTIIGWTIQWAIIAIMCSHKHHLSDTRPYSDGAIMLDSLQKTGNHVKRVLSNGLQKIYKSKPKSPVQSCNSIRSFRMTSFSFQWICLSRGDLFIRPPIETSLACWLLQERRKLDHAGAQKYFQIIRSTFTALEVFSQFLSMEE